MKIVTKISKIILILFILIFLGVLVVAITIDNSYKNEKICRSNNNFDIKNYQNINGISEIKLLSNCDKIKLKFKLKNSINSQNVQAIILQIVNKKELYNDNDRLEIILKNEDIMYLVNIDENETIDIDFVN